MTNFAKESDQRRQLKRQWSEFIDKLLHATGWTEADIGRAVGCSASCVSRWRNPDPHKGSIPSAVAAKALTAFAKDRGLID